MYSGENAVFWFKIEPVTRRFDSVSFYIMHMIFLIFIFLFFWAVNASSINLNAISLTVKVKIFCLHNLFLICSVMYIKFIEQRCGCGQRNASFICIMRHLHLVLSSWTLSCLLAWQFSVDHFKCWKLCLLMALRTLPVLHCTADWDLLNHFCSLAERQRQVRIKSLYLWNN